MTSRRLLGVAVGALVGLAGAPMRAAAQAAPGQLTRATQALARAADERQAKRATDRYDPIFRKYTKRYFGVGTDWRWFKAQGMAESDLTPGARSRVGARGIMQLMPSTYGLIRTALPSFGAIDNPEWNIAAGILHDRDLWTLWKPDVAEPERWTRRMLEHIGLPWDARCLEFQLTERPVLTASSWQVRQPLTASSVGRWRRYQRFLGPLIDAFGNDALYFDPVAVRIRPTPV